MSFSLYILVAVAVLALVDYIPRLFNRTKKAVSIPGTRGRRRPDFRIMPTVYGSIDYLDNIDFLKKYPKNTLICTSDHETEEFYSELRAICKKYGFSYAICNVPVVNGQPVKNAYSIYKGLFTRKRLPMKVGTPCILIDADTFAKDNLVKLVHAFKDSGADVASMRCEVADETTVIQQLQGFEYRMAMDNRRMDPWLTSGACNLSYARQYKKIFTHHSDFFAGGDIEIGKLAYTAGYKVKHIDFTFYTDAPATFMDWFNQRIIWYAGGFRHYIVSMTRFGWHHFFLLFYNALLIFLLFPIRWMETLFFPQVMLYLIVIAWTYIFILTYKKGWRLSYLFLPLYSFVQAMIIVPFGVARYILIAIKSRSGGRFRGMPIATGINSAGTALNTSLNYATAGVLLYIAYWIITARIDFWATASL